MAGVTGIMGWQAHVKAGSLRLLMVFDNQGTEQWPGVSTPKRLGHDFEMGPAFVISAPKGLPEPILNKLVAAFSEAMSSPEYQKLARDWELLYTTPFTGTDFQNWLHNQFKVYGEVIKQVGLEKKE
jgi:tripartite-type tricarboxylate transporter receptor subunit TctC